MQRMTDALSRMLNDPSTRMAMRSLQDNRDRIQESGDGVAGQGEGSRRRLSSDNSQPEEGEGGQEARVEDSAREEIRREAAVPTVSTLR
jgi:hypothetical protein